MDPDIAVLFIYQGETCARILQNIRERRFSAVTYHGIVIMVMRFRKPAHGAPTASMDCQFGGKGFLYNARSQRIRGNHGKSQDLQHG
jgi:hypothetical protein